MTAAVSVIDRSRGISPRAFDRTDKPVTDPAIAARLADLRAKAKGRDALGILKLALEEFVQQARHWIGALLLQLNGADALVFTAGIGENRAELREAICANLDQLGIVLDPKKNAALKAQEGVISTSDSRVQVMVIPTNEELVVAREVKRFLEKTGASN